jgi:hypothetical protein
LPAGATDRLPRAKKSGAGSGGDRLGVAMHGRSAPDGRMMSAVQQCHKSLMDLLGTGMPNDHTGTSGGPERRVFSITPRRRPTSDALPGAQ